MKMKMKSNNGINVYVALLFGALFLYILISIKLYLLTIISTFLLIIFISNKYSNYPSLILHYVNPFLVLHLQSYVLWIVLVGHEYDDKFIQIYLSISVVAIVTFNLFFFKFVNLETENFSKRAIKPIAFKLVKYISSIALFIYLGFFFYSDFEDKRAIKDFVSEHQFLKYLYALSNLFLVCIFYELLEKTDLKKQFKLLAIYGFIFLLVFLVIGERDLLFSLGVASIFVFSIKKGKFLITLYYLFTIVILFIGPYTQLLKSSLNGSQSISFEDKSFERSGFDDFMTTGHNSKRVYKINQLEPVEKRLLLSDMANVFGLKINSGKWYNRTFLDRPFGTTGLGFSLPLVGYLDYKLIGVLLLYAMLAFIVAKLYNIFIDTTIGVAFIIFLVTLLSYVQRQDLAYFLNLTIKFVLIPYFFLTKKNRNII